MTVKTAISLDDVLFAKAEKLMKELNISRSRLFATALEQFIQHHETQRMFAAINEAYDDFPDEEERAVQQEIQQYHKKQINEESW